MAQYNGKITLVNVNDGDGSSAIGIQSTKIYYGVSSDKNIKPTEWIEQVEGSQIPSTLEGQYLWTKTVFVYTDGKQTESYSYSYQGKDGKSSSFNSSYKMYINQNEILKFIDSNQKISLSPEKLEVAIYLQNPDLPNGEIQEKELDIGNINMRVFNKSTSSWIDAPDLTNVVSLTSTGTILIDLNKMLEPSEVGSAFQIFANEETNLEITYRHLFKNEKAEEQLVTLQSYVSSRYGMNKDMASLSLKSSGLVAAIQNTSLQFNSNGLTVNNGGIRINRKDGKASLSADLDGNLTITGTIYATDGSFAGKLEGATGSFSGNLDAAKGTFAGDISAATGSFKGDISAASGNIGGFSIGKGQLSSISKNDNNVSSIILDGQKGEIIANNILLGTGARIEKYIQIGPSVRLNQALTEGDSFLTVAKEGRNYLRFGADGILSVGDDSIGNKIIIDGANGSISSTNFNQNLGWKISNQDSVFNEVTIRGSIKASVFEYGNVQAIGGTMLIRPSSRIKDVIFSKQDIYKLILENTVGFEIGDSCVVEEDSDVNSKRNFLEILEKENNQITVKGKMTGKEIGKPIINFGQKGSIGIGINASSYNYFVPPQAISIFDFNNEAKQGSELTPHIILGKLPNEDNYGYAKNSYGLYAENVLLKGSLVTQSEITHENPTYSGISTLHQGVNAPTSDRYSQYFKDIDGNANTGEILLWAGAKGTSKSQIEDSKFFVDRNGNLFAGSGYFKGTIITDAKITASELETAVITGSNVNQDEPALTIKDTSKGILFTNSAQKEEIFKVTDNLLSANVTNIIFNKNFRIGENGNEYISKIIVTPYNLSEQAKSQEEGAEVLTFSNNEISFLQNFKVNEHIGIPKAKINFANGINLSADGREDAVSITEEEIEIKNALKFTKVVKYGELMEYKPVYHSAPGGSELIGYDLYID